ncbi:MAG: hypothetical protein ACT4QA_11760 [Panacagrimonas sp.]
MSIKHVVAAVVLFAAGGAAMAQDGAGAFAFTETVDISKVKVPGKDTNGDGCLEPAELTPGGQLAKRFATRDTNGDGKLCKDEYFTP